MIKVDATLFFILIESGIVFLGLTIFFFRKYRLQLAREAEFLETLDGWKKERDAALQQFESQSAASAEEIKRLNVYQQKYEDAQRNYEDMQRKFADMQNKFAELQEFNAKIKNQLTLVISKVEKNEELERMLADFERKDEELNSYVASLEREKRDLARKTEAFGTEIERLSATVERSVDKSEFERVSDENQGLKQRVSELETELKERNKVYENLVLKFNTLEREYTVLYEAHKDDEN